ncbi:MAG TPA: glycosyltransferase family 4 protein [Candidatus Andersenbacteria bacterium]|nr:MAG: hypothetical protein A2854_02100 [Parcubacteria group bacterium RIFCSPHIGHO2_01_FULL_56_18]HLD25632.1 glycosyltransferase family 4 protein [Candidatus Andersenbacteria bacterium]
MGNQVKALHLTPFYPPHIGGLENHAGKLDQLLAAQGVSITVFTARLPRSAAEHEKISPNLQVIRYPAAEIIPHYPIPAFWRPVFWQLVRSAQKNQPDVIMSRTRFFIASLFAVLLAKMTSKPHMHIEHGSDFPSLATPLLTKIAWVWDYTLGRFVLKAADALVANSRASASFVKKLSGRDSQVIYRGIDKAAIEKITSVNLSTHYSLLTTNSVIITYAGRLIFGKGVADLLHALQICSRSLLSPPKTLTPNPSPSASWRTRRGELKLNIIGSGPQEAELKQLTKKLGLENVVTFLGEQSFEQTISIMKSSDIFVNPSHTEGLPTSVIEAALCKIAIIATNVGGTPEIVTDKTSAILIPPKDPELLAQKLQQLIADPALRARLAENAFHEVSQKFSWDEAVQQYQNLFDKLADL